MLECFSTLSKALNILIRQSEELYLYELRMTNYLSGKLLEEESEDVDSESGLEV